MILVPGVENEQIRADFIWRYRRTNPTRWCVVSGDTVFLGACGPSGAVASGPLAGNTNEVLRIFTYGFCGHLP